MKRKTVLKKTRQDKSDPAGSSAEKWEERTNVKILHCKIGIRWYEKCFSKLDAAKVEVKNASFFAIFDKNVFLFR